MSIYPKPVQAKASEMISDLDDVLTEEDDISIIELEKSFADRLLKRFLRGEELLLNSSEIEAAVDEAAMQTSYKSLTEKGLMDSIEDENGKTVYFLTELGKSVGKALLEDRIPN
jgi:hypothetical protein